MARDIRIIDFDAVEQQPGAELHAELGGKGAGLAAMCALGLPVPAGFTITTSTCAQLLDGGATEAVWDDLAAAMARLEQRARRRFAAPADPLLVSVRSGAPASMPGMMDTVLNIGLTADVAAILARETGDAVFAWDSYRRLAQMYAASVLGSAADGSAAAQRIT
jgi:pyruvate,orthophosphate dikinase